jgi:hypothetical protein
MNITALPPHDPIFALAPELKLHRSEFDGALVVNSREVARVLTASALASQHYGGCVQRRKNAKRRPASIRSRRRSENSLVLRSISRMTDADAAMTVASLRPDRCCATICGLRSQRRRICSCALTALRSGSVAGSRKAI